MLLRMLSACAPCIGYWINPTAYSGQDQDPSDETIVVGLQNGGISRHEQHAGRQLHVDDCCSLQRDGSSP